MDRAAVKLALPREVGAEEAIQAGDGAAAAVRELTDGLGAELVLDMVGANQTLGLAAQAAGFESHATSSI